MEKNWIDLEKIEKLDRMGQNVRKFEKIEGYWRI